MLLGKHRLIVKRGRLKLFFKRPLLIAFLNKENKLFFHKFDGLRFNAIFSSF